MIRRSSVCLCSSLLSLAVVWGCGAAEDSEVPGDVPQFTPPTAMTPGATQVPGAPSNAPAPVGDGSGNGGEVTPTPSLQPPGGTPVANGGAGVQPPPPAAPQTPAAPAASGEPAPTEPAPVEPAQPAPGATASAGCALGNAAPALNVPNTIVTLPNGYDGSTPVPLLFAFHGADRSNLQMQMQDSRTVGSGLESSYVMAFVKSAGTAWDLNTDYPRFEAVLDQMLAQFCVDEAHLFAMGHSSGAQFIAQMLGNRAERRFAGVVPVSSNDIGATWEPVPTMLIHGLNDRARPNDLDGARDITQYTRSNQCGATFQAVNVPSCTTIAAGAAQVDPGCRQYDGCSVPTLFCNHNDPNYVDDLGPTNHGWPCFANTQILSFFESLR